MSVCSLYVVVPQFNFYLIVADRLDKLPLARSKGFFRAENRNDFFISGQPSDIEHALELDSGEIHVVATFAGAAGRSLLGGH